VKGHFISILLLIFVCPILQAQTEIEITNLSGGLISAQYNDSPSGEEVEKLTDNLTSTKFLTFNSSTWIQFKAPSSYIISGYSLTSGNDAPERDPLNWILEGSDNGVAYYTIDSQSEQDFPDRGLRKECIPSNSVRAYSWFRLTMSNNSGYILQLSELELFGVEGLPSAELFADFTVSSPLVAGTEITYTNASLNATSYSWTFIGGNPVTSTEANPKIVYYTPGNYNASLTASNGTSTSSKSISLTVRDVNDWSSFILPEVTIECVNTANPGYIKYKDLAAQKGFSSLEEFVRNCCLVIAKEFYYTPEEANTQNLRGINYKLNEGGNLSYKAGVTPYIEIGFDMNYLNSFSQSHTDSASADEIYGVLCHELAHGYQKAPRNAGVYGTPNEFYGFIEGSADLARLLTGGFNPPRTPKTGGNWKDGYNVTAFFYLWITETLSADFLRELNNSALTINPWSLNSVTLQLFDQSAQDLWDEYQLTLSNSINKTNSIKIYPNPADGDLFLSNLDGTTTIKIYNMKGMELVNRTTSDNKETIDIRNFTRGIYIVKISSKSGLKSAVFVKK
jgi:PKD repeat protein